MRIRGMVNVTISSCHVGLACLSDAVPGDARAGSPVHRRYYQLRLGGSITIRFGTRGALCGSCGSGRRVSVSKLREGPRERDLSLRINKAPSFRGISSTGTRLPTQSRVREVLARLLS